MTIQHFYQIFGDATQNCIFNMSSCIQPSSFCVAVMANTHCQVTPPLKYELTIDLKCKISQLLRFGPNEFAHIRQILKDSKLITRHLSSTQWLAVMQVSRYDIYFFLEHMWSVRNAIMGENLNATQVRFWLEISLNCFHHSSYFTSVTEFILIREKISSWLLSFKSNEACNTIQLLYSTNAFLSDAKVDSIYVNCL